MLNKKKKKRNRSEIQDEKIVSKQLDTMRPRTTESDGLSVVFLCRHVLKAFFLDVEEEVTGRTCKANNQLIALGTAVTISVRERHLQMTSNTRDKSMAYMTLLFLYIISLIRQ